jgi:hypothetical protein
MHFTVFMSILQSPVYLKEFLVLLCLCFYSDGAVGRFTAQRGKLPAIIVSAFPGAESVAYNQNEQQPAYPFTSKRNSKVFTFSIS